MPKRAAVAKRERHPMPDFVLNALEHRRICSKPTTNAQLISKTIMSAGSPPQNELRRSRLGLGRCSTSFDAASVYMKMAYKPGKK